jgi:hypothetical protein
MAIVITPPPAAPPFSSQTITITGLAATTNYVATLTWKATGRSSKIPFTSDGSGNASPNFVPQHDNTGPYTIDIRPAAELVGATTPAATSSTGRVN